jgi:hypothetical protein
MPSSSMTRRIIMVAKAHEADLKTAVNYALAVVDGRMLRQTEGDLYDHIKAYLARRGIDYEDEYMDPRRVPGGRAYYHR